MKDYQDAIQANAHVTPPAQRPRGQILQRPGFCIHKASRWKRLTTITSLEQINKYGECKPNPNPWVSEEGDRIIFFKKNYVVLELRDTCKFINPSSPPATQKIPIRLSKYQSQIRLLALKPQSKTGHLCRQESKLLATWLLTERESSSQPIHPFVRPPTHSSMHKFTHSFIISLLATLYALDPKLHSVHLGNNWTYSLPSRICNLVRKIDVSMHRGKVREDIDYQECLCI